ncbi:L-lactate dehydrogenase [Anaeroplasma bactoclasticum]|jgi:L-lactate dehydrogenase|uniref:L-lactate dehydrogenase n=1 Tax=Anaeroplasma bactoclasticum TaxID=2088 RepID=A0A397RU52_9MOLU|nr:L-lactate dehydrogenase [Anaeroplasma bactoclasticum]RIA77860.1 L-lactate dehydrogenase [Anaeroplasma bactoclasticum]
MINERKVAIIGAGFVGSSSAFALMQKGLFNELVLIDSNKAKAEGEAMDIAHGLAYSNAMKIYAGEYEDIRDAKVIIITAGANQKPGETRLDLIKKNSKIMTSIIKEIVRVKAEGLLLIVANPVDVLTHVALKVSGFKKERVIGSGTVLDTARLKYLLSEKLKVDTRNIHAVIMGEHGDSEFVAWSFSNVSGMPMEKFCHLRGFDDMDSLKEEIHIEVRDSAYHIIERKGATYYGIALSVVRICECIVKNQHSMLPISTELEGEYNAFGLALSVPAILGSDGVEAVLELPLSNSELKELEDSRNTLCNIIKDLEL